MKPFLRFMASSHQMQPSLRFQFLLFLFLLYYSTFSSTLWPVASSISFNFDSFKSVPVVDCEDETPGICIQGDAMILSSGVIQLTKNNTRDVGTPDLSFGRAAYSYPFHLWNSSTNELSDFTTHFSFFMESGNKSNNKSFGDGMAFFLSSYPSTIPTVHDHKDLGFSTFDKIVAVEFDTWKDKWDHSANHVGINVNSIESKVNTSSISKLNDGGIMNSWVTYNSTTFNLSVFLTDQAQMDITNLRSCLSYEVDLRNILPGQVAIGFSSSSYLSEEAHILLSWSFNSSLDENNHDTRSDGKNHAIETPPDGKNHAIETPPDGKTKSTNYDTPKQEDNNGLLLKIGVSIAVVVFVLILVLVGWHSFRFCRREKEEKVTSDMGMGERTNQEFTYNSLRAATNSFSSDRKLGAGGCGAVYRGFLPNLGVEVAIKRFSKESTQGQKAFEAEVNIISSLRHRNLVKLLGWCHENDELLIVYELMPNQSLDYWLFGRDYSNILTWSYRYNIAFGLASALQYLHEEWEKCVIHRDIKSSNVMLDSNFNAKLGDFGLARLTDHGVGPKTTTLFGTVGYMAPECYQDGKSTTQTDIYSFGVVLLEIASGRRASEVRLVEWVRQNHQNQTLSEVVDVNMEIDEVGKEQVKRLILVGIWCSNINPNLRPPIREAISSLYVGGPLPPVPVREHVLVDNPPSVESDLFPSAASSSHSRGSNSNKF